MARASDPQRKTLRIAAGVLSMLLLLAGCGGATHSAARPPLTQVPTSGARAFGFNEPQALGTLRLQAALRMPIRRYPVPWSVVEPIRGRWNWSYFDESYRAVLGAGLRPLIVAIGAPCWSQRTPEACQGGAAPPAAAELGAWASYVQQLAGRYPRAVGIEIWNEPNAAADFKPRPNPVLYARLLSVAYRAVKSVDPRMPVVSGGLVATSGGGGFVLPDWQFLRAVYRAGAGRDMDAIGAHPYPVSSGGDGVPRSYDLAAMERDIDRLRAVRDAAGLSGLPIWITEVGVATASGPGFPPAATEHRQAALISAVIKVVEHSRDVPVAIVDRLVDASSGGLSSGGGVEAGFGVFRADGRPKASACALSGDFHGYLHC